MKLILCSKEDLHDAKSLAVKLKTELSTISIENFSGNEKFVCSSIKLRDLEEIIVFKSLWPNPNDKILELLLILDFIKYNSNSNIELYIPFIPYLRQDRELSPNSAIASRMLSDVINLYKVSKIYTIDAHSIAAINFFKGKLISLNSSEYFANEIKRYISSFESTIVIAPDEGSVERAKNLSKLLSVDYYFIKKTRTKDGKIQSEFDLSNFYTNIIIVDDMIDSGRTIHNSLKILENKAKNIFICITHVLQEESIVKITKEFPTVKFINLEFAKLMNIVY